MKLVTFAHFLPDVNGKRRSHLLSHKALSYYSFLLLFLMASIRVTAVRMPGVLGYASNINASDLYKYTNEQRKLKGLSELNLDPDLTKAASAKAEDMFKNNYWAHVSPSGIEPWYFFSRFRINFPPGKLLKG